MRYTHPDLISSTWISEAQSLSHWTGREVPQVLILWLPTVLTILQYPHMTTGKTIALTRWAFVGKVMSLLFNMLSRLVIILFQGVSVF